MGPERDPAGVGCDRERVRRGAPPVPTPLALEALALQLIARLLRAADKDAPTFPKSRPPTWLRRVEERLRHDTGDPVRLGDLAREAGVDPSHLSRALGAHYGMSPGQYLRAARVAEARRRLLETNQPLVEVALGSGFADQSHMTRVFRRHTGTTPGQLRASRE